YRQAEIFARERVDLETSTLSGWVGAAAAALAPLINALTADVMASDTLHVDDTPVPVLAPGTGKTKTGGCGPTSATSGRSPAPDHRPRCSSTRRIVKVSTRGTTEGVPRHDPCRRLCRLQRVVRRRPHRRSRLLGPRQAQVLRRADVLADVQPPGDRVCC